MRYLNPCNISSATGAAEAVRVSGAFPWPKALFGKLTSKARTASTGRDETSRVDARFIRVLDKSFNFFCEAVSIQPASQVTAGFQQSYALTRLHPIGIGGRAPPFEI